MTEQVRESLSALLDNEASELDIQRLINAQADKEMAQFCQRTELVKAVMTGSSSDYSAVDLSQSISQAIENEPSDITTAAWQGEHATKDNTSAGLSNQPSAGGAVAAVSNFFTGRNMGGLAVAASVALAVVFGVKQIQTPVQLDPTQIVQQQQQPEAITVTAQQQQSAGSSDVVIATRSVNSESIARAISKQTSAMPTNSALLARSNAEKGLATSHKLQQPNVNSDQLNKYYQEHAEHSALRAGRGMMPFARIVNYKSTTSSE